MSDDLDEQIARVQAEADARVADLRQRADTAAGRTVDELRDAAEAAEAEDFDAFWRAQNRRGRVLHSVLGLDLYAPTTLPLRFEVDARRLVGTKASPEHVQHMFGLVFGPDTYDELVTRGLDTEQFVVLLAWGVGNASGRTMTLADARAEVQRRQVAAAEGKAPGPGSGATSSGSGRSSKRTSRANTGSTKKRSPR